jgi:trans-2,3-dihydro-3-hydroxyanthranilate isomerase
MLLHSAQSTDPCSVDYYHADVFSDGGYTGNSLAVFVNPPPLDAGQMSRITQELRHFESIFVTESSLPGVVRARVFDLADELEFAGHPLLGAAAVLHERAAAAAGDEERCWTLELPARTVAVRTCRHVDGRLSALLDPGRLDVVRSLPRESGRVVADALSLDAADLDATLPLEVLSTGLRYLVVPVRDADALARARIRRPDFEAFLAEFDAQFVYVLDVGALEGRHWNNDGVVEDVATASAAGCVAGYLLRHGRAHHGDEIFLAQGRFVGRPSRIAITAFGTKDAVERITVRGDVAIVGAGNLRALPPPENS